MVQDVAQAAGITEEDRSWSLVDDCFDMTLHHISYRSVVFCLSHSLTMAESSGPKQGFPRPACKGQA